MNNENEIILTEVQNALQTSNHIINKLTEMLAKKDEIILSREKELEAVATKVDFYDAITESDDWMEMSAVAKVLAYKGWGRNKMFELLRNRQILRYNNEPYQQYVEKGYFKTIEQAVSTGYDSTIVNRKTLISQKGLDFIRKILIAEGAA